MAASKNLKPIKKGQLTREEAKARGSKGGIASVEARRKKKSMQELAGWVLEMPLTDASIENVTSLAGASGKNITVKEAALLAQANKAIHGDAKALEILRDTAGEKPVERLEVNADVAEAEAEIAALIAKRKASGDG